MPQGTDGESGHEILMLQSAASCNEKSQSHGVGHSRLHYSQISQGGEDSDFQALARNMNLARICEVKKS
ncbi:hypothetical protein Pmani_025016 [Petrolisthes manimaculis]|uniref:Uncharacterized protein n=1 Tax=Petrolisthes manimaculis TaxID=1843537 RepID=A0AAE1TY56_9EUCA|nr:hypothetical protein Pmani_025016 [Petrolisthes manimaculis]